MLGHTTLPCRVLGCTTLVLAMIRCSNPSLVTGQLSIDKKQLFHQVQVYLTKLIIGCSAVCDLMMTEFETPGTSDDDDDVSDLKKTICPT